MWHSPQSLGDILLWQWQSIQQLLRYFRLGQNRGLTNYGHCNPCSSRSWTQSIILVQFFHAATQSLYCSFWLSVMWLWCLSGCCKWGLKGRLKALNKQIAEWIMYKGCHSLWDLCVSDSRIQCSKPHHDACGPSECASPEQERMGPNWDLVFSHQVKSQSSSKCFWKSSCSDNNRL